MYLNGNINHVGKIAICITDPPHDISVDDPTQVQALAICDFLTNLPTLSIQ